MILVCQRKQCARISYSLPLLPSFLILVLTPRTKDSDELRDGVISEWRFIYRFPWHVILFSPEHSRNDFRFLLVGIVDI